MIMSLKDVIEIMDHMSSNSSSDTSSNVFSLIRNSSSTDPSSISSGSSTDDDDDDEEEEEEEEEEELPHPRCLYQDIGMRDVWIHLKAQLPGLTGSTTTALLSDAQDKKLALLEQRRATSLQRGPATPPDEWARQLAAAYRRDARALLAVLETDMAYFRAVLFELVSAFCDGALENDESDDEWHYNHERLRLHEEIGDTRANILVLRLRREQLLGRFVDAFARADKVEEGDWAVADQLIPAYRTPHKRADRYSGIKDLGRTRLIEQERQQTADAVFAAWGLERPRRSGERERGSSQRGLSARRDKIRFDSFVPPCLSGDLASYLFGKEAGRDVTTTSPKNVVPKIKLGVGRAVMAPVLAEDILEVVDCKNRGTNHVFALSPSRDTWLRKQMIPSEIPHGGAGEMVYRYEFAAPPSPLQPHRRFAFFHLLINMLHARRWQGKDEDWHDEFSELLRAERWGLSQPWLRKSTVLKMAQTIGLIKDFGAEFEAGFEDRDDADADDDDMDMLITNIVEEHLFPSPAVVFPDESKFARLVYGETDIVANMQRRGSQWIDCIAPGTGKCVFGAKRSTYLIDGGLENYDGTVI
ncbi:hypothetical protein IWX49DRAFT_636590 [Phyllosticta citricarpa]|uniref:Uncharacterized protein n=2 Tax=Phyllosticta TaxID=121621 RepID=A0ABR1MFK5_9PEZI